MAVLVKTLNGLAYASVKTKNGLAVASIKTMNGIDTTAAGGDPDWASVVLLLHCDGIDASTSFPDNSDSAHTITANGNAQVDTAQFQFGTASALFDGDDWLSVPDSADWDFGTGDMTIEFWVRYNGNEPQATRGLISSGAVGSVASFWTLEGISGNKLGFFNSAFSAATPLLSSTTTSWADTWRMVVITRTGTTWRMIIDGTVEATATDSAACNSDGQLVIGSGFYAPSTRGVSAWIDELRITNGVGRYTAGFTPPSAAFPDF